MIEKFGTMFNFEALLPSEQDLRGSHLSTSLILNSNVEESAAERFLASLWRVLEEHDLATPLLGVRSTKKGSIDITLTFPLAGDRALAADALAAVTGEVAASEMRAVVDAGDQQETRDRINKWRQRAEELRTAADQFREPSAQESLRRAGRNCEQMADYAEAILKGKPTPHEKAG